MKPALVSLFVCAFVLAAGLADRDAHGESMSCLGACRVDYAACLMDAKQDAPAAAEAHRAQCGRAYLRCSSECKSGAHQSRVGRGLLVAASVTTVTPGILAVPLSMPPGSPQFAPGSATFDAKPLMAGAQCSDVLAALP